jgi:acetyltransferase-like isoleucine patch superfamily enzyme/coenzyme F420-reducing hydrogenase beta subunit
MFSFVSIDLKSRFTTDPQSILSDEKFLQPVDYTPVNARITEERSKSLAWLRDALQTPIAQTAVILEPPAPGLIPYYSKKSYENKVNEPYCVCSKDACTGCAACYNSCPSDAISMTADNEGFLYPRINQERCTQCDLCKDNCPVLNPKGKILLNEPPKEVYAAYSLDKKTRFMSTSGGAFTEFAKYMLSIGGVCYGAAYDDNFKVKHICITDEAELASIRQSKYYQSEIGDIYKTVQSDLEQGMSVLFCGTPCQCAGLYNFLGKEYNNLLIVDFICHSINSPKAFSAYLHEKEEDKQAKASVVWFKNKEEGGWQRFGTRIDFVGKEYYYREYWPRDAFMLGFLKYRLYCRPSCHQCSFKEFKRVSDVTLADFWGLIWNEPANTDDMKHGVTAVLINSGKGSEVFDHYVKQNMYVEAHTLDDVLPKNGGMLRSNTPGLYRDFFWEQIDKVPFSKIIDTIDKHESALVAEREKKKTVPGRVTGKLTKLGNVVIELHENSEIIINGELILNSHLPMGSKKECVVILHSGAKLVVNGRFALAYDSVLQLFPGATLTVNSGFVNAGATFAMKGNSSIGSDFLCGRHFVMSDSDHHQVVDLATNTRTNPNADIYIGNHVWCGEGAAIMKGVTIGDGSIISTKSLVTKSVPENCVAAGVPAKVIRTNASWKY